MSHVAVIADKPSAIHFLHPHVAARHPRLNVVYVTTLFLGLLAFSYPRGVRMADYPSVEDPAWRVRRQEEFGASALGTASFLRVAAGADAGEMAVVRADPFEAVRSADRILFAATPGRTDVVNHDNIMMHAFGGEDDRRHEAVDAVRVSSLSASSLVQAFAEVGTTHDPWFVDLLGQGRLRRLFDYSYDANALALFDPELPEGTRRGTISKASLQLLYHMRSTGPMTEAAVISAMHTWRGTGRYPTSRIGSPSSWTIIVARLLSVQLLAGGSDGMIGLSDAGRHFLDRLHPGCEDADQIARLDAWCRDWRSSRPAVERYLRAFFGRQKRFPTEGR